MMVSNKENIIFGRKIKITDKVALYNPTLDEIFKFGKEKYWAAVNFLLNAPNDYRKYISECYIEYKDISEFVVFMLLIKFLPSEHTKIIIDDLDLTKFDLAQNDETGELVFYDFANEILINEDVYNVLITYIKRINGLEDRDYINNANYDKLAPIFKSIKYFGLLNISTFTDFIRRGILEIN